MMFDTKFNLLLSSPLLRMGFQKFMSSQVNNVLRFCQHGEPLEVLEMDCEHEVKCPKGNQVLVRMVAAPLHPVDVCVIKGEYPFLPCLPGIGGHEGYGRIVSIGEKVKKFCPGDRVVFNQMGLGTWRDYAMFTPDVLHRISNKICLPEAATFLINPGTAYRMLKDFVPLKSGDTVIHNCADSAVGQAVHQISKIWKYKSVGIINSHEDVDDTKKYLKSLGASEILTEEEFLETNIFEKKLKKPKLALNCAGSESARNLACRLDCNGTLVTYSNVSCQPFYANPEAMMYRNIRYQGFWLHCWLKKNKNSKEFKKMFKDLTSFYEKRKLKAPKHEIIPFANYENAEENFKLSPCYGRKTIFELEKECC